jgi:hypothetical protein
MPCPQGESMEILKLCDQHASKTIREYWKIENGYSAEECAFCAQSAQSIAKAQQADESEMARCFDERLANAFIAINKAFFPLDHKQANDLAMYVYSRWCNRWA